MKKFMSKLILFLAVFCTSVVLVPWNRYLMDFFGNPLPGVTEYMVANEFLYKAIIAGAMFLFSLVYLIISIHDEKNYGEVKPSVAAAAIVPMWLFGVAMLGFTTILLYFLWLGAPTTPNLILLGGAGIGLLNAIVLGHLVLANFRKGRPLTKIMLFVFALEVLGVGGYAGYLTLAKSSASYAGLHVQYYVGAVPLFLVFYVVHIIIMGVRGKKAAEPVDIEQQVKEVRHAEKAVTKSGKSEPIRQESHDGGRKTMIVSKEQTIISGEQNIDPTNMLFEDVSVDPEFNRTANLDKQVSSIEYYIEKPKMFKPLDPTFDQLVAYVRELPNAVTKLADDRITFYVDRKPFLVLMNFGNYYRLAFRSELEKGIRMIIKYPTISKNKGTKDNLWFKANNYGDLPKEVVYDIAKSAFDNVHA